MTPAPERALELAEWAEDAASYIDTEDEIGHSLHEAEEEKLSYMQLAKIARHYAEIMQYEVAAYVDEHGNLRGAHLGLRAEPGVQLIIKPTP